MRKEQDRNGRIALLDKHSFVLRGNVVRKKLARFDTSFRHKQNGLWKSWLHFGAHTCDPPHIRNSVVVPETLVIVGKKPALEFVVVCV